MPKIKTQADRNSTRTTWNAHTQPVVQRDGAPRQEEILTPEQHKALVDAFVGALAQMVKRDGEEQQ